MHAMSHGGVQRELVGGIPERNTSARMRRHQAFALGPVKKLVVSQRVSAVRGSR